MDDPGFQTKSSASTTSPMPSCIQSGASETGLDATPEWHAVWYSPRCGRHPAKGRKAQATRNSSVQILQPGRTTLANAELRDPGLWDRVGERAPGGREWNWILVL